MCHSRSHLSPTYINALLLFSIPDFTVPYSPDAPFVHSSTFVFVHPFINQFPSSSSSFLHHPKKLFPVPAVSLKLHLPVLHSHFLAAPPRFACYIQFHFSSMSHLVLLLISSGYSPLKVLKLLQKLHLF